MQVKMIINNLRYQNLIKGKRPAIVKGIKASSFKSFNRNILVSIDDDYIYFQGLKRFFNTYTKMVNSVKIKDVKDIIVINKKVFNEVTIYTKDKNFYTFLVYSNNKDYYDSMVNVEFIIKRIKTYGKNE